jgi:hypothetical protein
MNSKMSDLDNLAADDIAGAEALYPIQAAAITSQPQSETVTVGSTATFSVTASGSQPLSYQWRFNGGNIPGATAASYTIASAQANQAGSYTVVVSNQGASVTSAPAVLSVNVPPSITLQPQSQVVNAGKSVTFSVNASGTTPLSYQWYRNGSPLGGATGVSYTIGSSQPSNAGDYMMTVANIAGSATSSIATLTVLSAPQITSEPQSQTVIVGDTVTLTVGANGTAPLKYQWWFNGVKIPTGTGSSLTLTNVQSSQAGSYAVNVSNSYGYTNTPNAVLTVNPIPPCVTPPSGLVSWWQAEGNADDSVDGNSGVLLNGATFGPGKVGQAFAFDGVSSYVGVPDSPSLHCTNGLTIEAWIFLTGSTGNYYNTVTKWDVTTPGQAAYTSGLIPDGRIGFSVCSSGNGPDSTTDGTVMSTNTIPANQWTHYAGTYDGSELRIYVNGVCENVAAYNQGIFPGTGDLAIGSAGTSSSGQVVSPFAGLIDEPAIYDRALSAGEIAALYNANKAGKCPLAPMVRSQPANQAAIVGDTVTYTVAAGGTPPLRYQWRFNSRVIAAASSASLTLTNVQSSQAGNYDVIVSNGFGSVTSAVATLSVQVPTNIDFDFETAETTPLWFGTTQMVQNTSASHQGTNAAAFSGIYPDSQLMLQLPQNTRKVEFYFYDDYGPNPPLYQYMYFRLLESTNATEFAGFSMLDGGWGTNPPMTMNHYYAYANEEYSLRTMGPVRTIGWHKFTFALGPGSVGLSIDGGLVFQTNMVRVAQYFQLASASCSTCSAWGRMDDLVITYIPVTQPTLTVSQIGNGARLAWPVSAAGFLLQESVTPSGNWTNSAATVSVQGNENVAVIPATGAGKFYRLIK